MRPDGPYRRLVDLALGGRRRAAAEMDRELESHLAMREEDLVRAGMSRDAAREEARRRFGNFESARKRLHAAATQRDAAVRQRDMAGALVADMRFAIRQSIRAPGFTALTVATLALGLGATTAIFTVVDRVLLRPLPFPSPEQLFTFSGLDSSKRSTGLVSSADWLDWRLAPSLAASALYSIPFRQGVVTSDSAVRVSAVNTTARLFEVLGSRFVAGRPFTEADLEEGSNVVVISERLWREWFGGDPTLARPLRTASRAWTVVGVVARDQGFPADVDVWFPVKLTLASDPWRVDVNWFMVVRERPGVADERMYAELTAAARAIHDRDPAAIYDFGVSMESLSGSVTGSVATYLSLLMATVSIVLLIVCANVAASGVARTASREREMAVRASLGAGRGRLIQQMLIEHVWLAAVGGAVGVIVAWAAVRAFVVTWGGRLPRAGEIGMDWRVFLFALGVSLVAGLAAGIVPALRLTRVSLSRALAGGGRGAARGGRTLAGSWLVSAEIALAVLLLTGAGLLVRSFRVVLARDIGFDTNVATAEAALAGPVYSKDTVRRYEYWDGLIDQYRAIPGVESVGLSQWIPLGLTGQGFIDVEGRDEREAGAVYRTVSRDFFRTLRIPLVSGRTFDEEDGVGTPRVVVINRAMADAYWPRENPLGRRVRARSQEPSLPGKKADWLTVIGVVGDIRTYGLETPPRPEMYVYFRQTPWRTSSMTVLVRGAGPASRFLGEMRRRARLVDPRNAVDVGTLTDRLHATLSTRSLAMAILSGFAGAALLLAALGIYSVLSFSVAQRTRELAVRAALGARRPQLLALVFRSAAPVVAIGGVLGLGGAIALTRVLASMLVGVTPLDPVSFVFAAGLLLVVVAAAVAIPAVRATRLDPAIALQAE